MTKNEVLKSLLAKKTTIELNQRETEGEKSKNIDFVIPKIFGIREKYLFILSKDPKLFIMVLLLVSHIFPSIVVKSFVPTKEAILSVIFGVD